jgi:hypothetical protein
MNSQWEDHVYSFHAYLDPPILVWLITSFETAVELITGIIGNGLVLKIEKVDNLFNRHIPKFLKFSEVAVTPSGKGFF